ncbi:EAL domain-containing protein (putative c-di-GMP-specific phosphodiesterase class I) [Hoeflea marina]|uniref:EAL domain-containing protein (Putative c-di-GMP-specific phosphodiesterase class I) n=1 Tax=Hoeflea marina TaxID=274592 RepID=A0A317PH30_9HYPH|nr:EAL domain-containing protein [Hoeflea marina]PWV99246.1 EAL domain-containing protein (putative c-di-GMP-specific phosphodiesterase class I) [Hoeflea marina]
MSAKSPCAGCRNTDPKSFAIPFTMAFQPIIDVSAGDIWGYEALVRGMGGQSAAEVLAEVTDQNRYAFDQACRVTAIELAGKHMPSASTAILSVNFLPNAVYEPRACIRATLEAAARSDFAPHRLMFEFTENEAILESGHIARIVETYRAMGFTTALDDFGAGYAGLTRLALLQTDLIKLDMELVHDIDKSLPKRAIVSGVLAICKALDITVLAEGAETEAEVRTLHEAGVDLFQGYYFARPKLEAFEDWGVVAARAA